MRRGLGAALLLAALIAVPAAQPRTSALAPAILSASLEGNDLTIQYAPPDYCPSGYYDFLVVNDDGTTGSDGKLQEARNVSSFVCSWTSIRFTDFADNEGPGTHYIQVEHWDADRLSFYYSNVVQVVVPSASASAPVSSPPVSSPPVSSPPVSSPSSQPEEMEPIDFDWEMPERYRIGRRALDVTPASWRVDFFVSGSDDPSNCPSDVAYSWTVDGRPVRMTRGHTPGRIVVLPDACQFHYRFPREGRYDVAVTATRGGSEVGTGAHDVLVQDWLIVGLGDSVASGEGNPSVAGWDDRRCHRSPWAFESWVADAIEERDLRTSVTFVSVACSGASIAEGLLGPYEGIEPPKGAAPLLPQLEQARRIVGRREIDAVLVSIGANDVHFGDIVKFCLGVTRCSGRHPWWSLNTTLDDSTTRGLAVLRGRYFELGTKLARLAPRNRVYITEYFDPTADENGVTCKQIAGLFQKRHLVIDEDEARWAYGRVVLRLNQAVAFGAGRQRWNLVRRIREEFRRHGYCAIAPARWIVQILESVENQGNLDGALHPNSRGHARIATLVGRVLRPDLYPGGSPRPPSP